MGNGDMAVLKARTRARLRRSFVPEENGRIAAGLKNRELEAVRTRAEKQAAALAEGLAEADRKLKETQMHLIHALAFGVLGLQQMVSLDGLGILPVLEVRLRQPELLPRSAQKAVRLLSGRAFQRR